MIECSSIRFANSTLSSVNMAHTLTDGSPDLSGPVATSQLLTGQADPEVYQVQLLERLKYCPCQLPVRSLLFAIH